MFVYLYRHTSLADTVIHFPGSYILRANSAHLASVNAFLLAVSSFSIIKKRSLFLKLMALLFSKDGSLNTHCYRCRTVQGELGKKRKLQQISGEKKRDLRKQRNTENWKELLTSQTLQ